MAYYIDLSSISIDGFKNKLKTSDLLRSRMILKDRIDERFSYFKSIGIKSLFELQQILKMKNRFAELSKVNCLDKEYLTILLREINSMHPKPNKLKEFIGISPDTILKLEKHGIKDTPRLYEKVITPESRMELANNIGISESELSELTRLTDLSRIKWVGVTFARMLYEIGIDTVEKASKADFEDLYRRINQVNREKNYYKGQIGLNDMKLFVNAAKEVPQEIQY